MECWSTAVCFATCLLSYHPRLNKMRDGQRKRNLVVVCPVRAKFITTHFRSRRTIVVWLKINSLKRCLYTFTFSCCSLDLKSSSSSKDWKKNKTRGEVRVDPPSMLQDTTLETKKKKNTQRCYHQQRDGVALRLFFLKKKKKMSPFIYIHHKHTDNKHIGARWVSRCLSALLLLMHGHSAKTRHWIVYKKTRTNNKVLYIPVCCCCCCCCIVTNWLTSHSKKRESNKTSRKRNVMILIWSKTKYEMSLISSVLVLVVVVSYYTISLSFVDLKKKIQRNVMETKKSPAWWWQRGK